MRALLRALALGVGPLVVVAGIAKSSDHLAFVYELKSSVSQVRNCSTPPAFQVFDDEGERHILPLGEGFKFYGNGWLRADVCAATTLQLVVRGELGGSEKPILSVALGNELLGMYHIDKKTILKIPLSHPGAVYMGFTNDYILTDTRVATFRNIVVSTSGCNGFESVSIPESSGGRWSFLTHTGQILREKPLIFVPCGSGKMSFEISGSKGGNYFPIVIISQSGKAPVIIKTSAEWREINFDMDGLPFEIFVSNPYIKTILDRNIVVEKTDFLHLKQ